MSELQPSTFAVRCANDVTLTFNQFRKDTTPHAEYRCVHLGVTYILYLWWHDGWTSEIRVGHESARGTHLYVTDMTKEYDTAQEAVDGVRDLFRSFTSSLPLEV